MAACSPELPATFVITYDFKFATADWILRALCERRPACKPDIEGVCNVNVVVNKSWRMNFFTLIMAVVVSG